MSRAVPLRKASWTVSGSGRGTAMIAPTSLSPRTPPMFVAMLNAGYPRRGAPAGRDSGRWR